MNDNALKSPYTEAEEAYIAGYSAGLGRRPSTLSNWSMDLRPDYTRGVKEGRKDRKAWYGY